MQLFVKSVAECNGRGHVINGLHIDLIADGNIIDLPDYIGQKLLKLYPTGLMLNEKVTKADMPLQGEKIEPTVKIDFVDATQTIHDELRIKPKYGVGGESLEEILTEDVETNEEDNEDKPKIEVNPEYAFQPDYPLEMKTMKKQLFLMCKKYNIDVNWYAISKEQMIALLKEKLGK